MITVRPAVGPDVEAAVRLLMQQVPQADRQQHVANALASAAHGELVLDDLLIGYRDAEPVGAILTVIQPGQTASIWPPEVANADDEMADALVAAAVRHLEAAGVTIIQSILEPDDHSGRQLLTRNGIGYLTDLLFMERNLDHHWPQDTRPPLKSVVYSTETHDRFVALLEQTYQATLDCPELDGIRTAEQALASHQAAGRFAAETWRLYCIDGVDAGVLLLSEHPDQRAWELVYMGVGPSCRGEGLGWRMLLDALPKLPRTAADTVFLAVDCRNRYASATYERLGFSALATRALHLYLTR